jgi:type VI protein secretion system component VasK
MSDKAGKKAKKMSAEEPAEGVVSIAAHPRAKASVRRVRARTALAAFVIVLLMSLHASVPGQEAVMRAVVGGLVGNLIGWFCALAVWRAIVVQEVRLVEQVRRERARARAEAAAVAAEAA